MFSIPVGVKRKHQDADLSDDDDEPSLGRQVLPVANLPASFNGTPEDGLQYLFTVRRDARTLPHVTRAANPYEVKEEPRDTVRDELAAEHPLLPSERWREIFLKRFKNFRKHALQSTVGGRGPSSSRKVIPDKRERDLWWAFLAGQPQSAWDPPKKPKQPKNTRWGGYAQGPEGYGVDTLAYSEERRPPQHLSYSLEDGRVFSTSSTDMWRVSTDGVELTSAMNATMSLPTPSGTPAPPDRLEDQASTVEGSSSLHAILPPKPTPTLMRQIDHRYALHLLMYFAYWINGHLERGTAPSPYPVSEAHSPWIFVLLSRVEEYVTADEMSLLRNLARACISLIEENRTRETSSIVKPAEGRPHLIDEPTCWMVVTAVVGVWGQKDLWMDAEAMLRRLPSS
ncbi:hypothetical protein C8Q72DRAFT_875595 [Fomitopsis betulina]|nr:hypothetical protein C8Q72DRAFT_875595 [Fomitopsis betulina]